MKNLFEIQTQYMGLFSEIENAEGVVSDSTLQMFEETEQALKGKLDAYQYRILTLQAEAQALKAEADRLKDKSATKQKAIDRLKKIVAETVARHGNPTKTGHSLDTGKFKISTTNRNTLEIEKGVIVPDKYTYTVSKVDKTALRHAVLNGEQIEGIKINKTKSIKVK